MREQYETDCLATNGLNCARGYGLLAPIWGMEISSELTDQSQINAPEDDLSVLSNIAAVRLMPDDQVRVR
jgi:hypothetical protein